MTSDAPFFYDVFYHPSLPHPTTPHPPAGFQTPGHPDTYGPTLVDATVPTHDPLYQFSTGQALGLDFFGARDIPIDPSFQMPSFQNMNSAALVAAALGPEPDKISPHSRSGVPKPSTVQEDWSHTQLSSPLTELSDRDFSSSTEHRTTAQSDVIGKGKRTRLHHSSDEEHIVPCTTHSRSSVIAQRQRASHRSRESTYHDMSGAEDNKSSPSRLQQSGITIRNARNSRRLIRKKPPGTRVPPTLDEAGEADRMMWNWKNLGKGWDDIRSEWRRLTGVMPGTSTLSVRYIKLNEKFARNGAAGDRQLVKFKNEAEEEIQGQLWEKVAAKMRAFSQHSEYNPKDLKRRYEALVRNGDVFHELSLADQPGGHVKKEDENESSYLHSIEQEFSDADKAIDMDLAHPDLEDTTITSSQDHIENSCRYHSSPSVQLSNTEPASQTIVWDTVEEAIQAEQEAGPSMRSVTHGRCRDGDHDAVDVEDEDSSYQLYSEGRPHPRSDDLKSGNSSAQLASSPFFHSLMAYLSEDEDDDDVQTTG